MAVMSTSGTISSRFSSYVGELREVFGQHGVQCGSAEDLETVADRLTTQGALADDVSSILRSAILREGGSLPYTELFQILLVAVVGAELDPAAEAPLPGFRQLLSFAGSVARRPWNVPPGEKIVAGDEVTFAPELQRLSGQRTNAGHVPVEAERQPEAVEEAVEEVAAPEPPFVAGPMLGSAMAAALAALPPATVRQDIRHEEIPDALDSGSWALEDGEYGWAEIGRTLDDDGEAGDVSGDSLPVMPPPPPGSSAPLWIGAACAVALIFALTMWTRSLYAPHTPPVDAAVRVAAVEPMTMHPPKPTAALTLPVAAVAQTTVPVAKASVTKPARADGGTADDGTEVPARPAAPRHRPLLAVKTAAPIVRVQEPAQTVSPRTETAPVTQPAEKPITQETASMPPPPQPWGRMPAPVHSDDDKSPYFQVSAGVMASHLLLSPDPGYPTLAKLTHIQGQVIMETVISSDGEVIAARVLSGHRLLRGAAVSAVKRRRYRPYVLDGRPVDVATTVTVDFREGESER